MRLALSLSLLLALPSLQAAPVSLVQNEYNFAAAVARHGVRDGFLAYLATQSITFAPTPVNAYDRYQQRKPSSAQLRWYPVYALVSASGEFGVDTGPWSYRAAGKDGKPVQAHGEWLTLWARDKSGNWKALFDGGISHDAPAKPPRALSARSKVAQLPAGRGAPPSRDETQNELVRVEAVFSNDAAGHGLQAAYRSSGAADIRLLTENTLPQVGTAALDALSDQPVDVEWAPMGGSVAQSGDLGYVYGMTYKLNDPQHRTPQHAYVHVWRHAADGWKLQIALETPAQ